MANSRRLISSPRGTRGEVARSAGGGDLGCGPLTNTLSTTPRTLDRGRVRRRRPLKTRLARGLRKNMTETEVRLWLLIRGRQLMAGVPPADTDRRIHRRLLLPRRSPRGRTRPLQPRPRRSGQSRQASPARLKSKGYRVLRLSADYPEDDYLDGVWETIPLALEQTPGVSPFGAWE